MKSQELETRAGTLETPESRLPPSSRAGLVEKDEFIKKIHAHFGIKSEL